MGSCPRNVWNVGYAVTLRACSVRCRYLTFALTLWLTNFFWRTRRYKSIYNLKIDTIEMLIHHSKNAFFSALKRHMTCHAIYWQKARTKSKVFGGSDRLTAVCVCKMVKGVIRLRADQIWTCNVSRHHRPLLSSSLLSRCFSLPLKCSNPTF
jgi:hypothetical protein